MKLTALNLVKLTVFFILVSCQKEEYPIDHDNSTHKEKDYLRKVIDFDQFANEFFTSRSEGLTDYFNLEGFKGGNNFIKHVNTNKIIEFSNDNITTYTLNVETSKISHESFTNLVYFKKGNTFGEVILQYTPSSEWLNSLLDGNRKSFSGSLSVMNSQGEILQTTEIGIEGNVQSRGGTECFISTTPIWNECYGRGCPCSDGNGYAGGMNVTITCTSGGGGGNYGNGNNNGGGPNGTGGPQQQGHDGDLPTDPIEWALFMELNKLRGPDDIFWWDDSINQYNSAEQFTSIGDFVNYMNDKITDVVATTSASLPGKSNRKITISLGAFVDLNIIIKQNLKSQNQPYVLDQLITSYTGLVFGTEWTLTEYHWHFDENEIVTLDVYGDMEYKLFLEGIGAIYKDAMHFEIKLDGVTGDLISITEK